MSKVISQDTFNGVVQENIDDFDMDEDEAVKDAVAQFEAQGVNLCNIIKNPKVALEITNLIQELNTIISSGELSCNTETVLKKFSSSVKNALSCKLLAAEKGAYKTLIECLKKSSDQLKIATLEALIAFMDGYPDLLDPEGSDLLLGLLEDTPEIIEPSLRWLIVSVTKQEKTRSYMINKQVANKLKILIENYPDRQEIVAGVCKTVQVLILDDDIRVTHGDAHEHTRALANQLLQPLILMLNKYISNKTLTTDILAVLSALLVRNEFCIEFHENDGLKFVLDAMVEHPDDENVSRQCFLLLKGLAGSDEVKEAIIASGAAPLIVASLNKHYKNSNVAIAGCMCLAALTLRSPSNTQALAGVGAPETLVRCLFHWKKNVKIVKFGCSAIRNQLSRCPELKEEYSNLQVEELLKDAEKLHGDLGFEAKNVLLDLGCDVKLKEEWQGTGIQMQQ